MPDELTAVLAELKRLMAAATPGPYEARYVPSGMPTACVQFGIIAMSTGGLEISRVWNREDVEVDVALRNHADALISAAEERDALAAKVSIAEETGVQFCDLEGGGVGCSIPMTEELSDALGQIFTLTDKSDAQAAEIAQLKENHGKAVDVLNAQYDAALDTATAQAAEIVRLKALVDIAEQSGVEFYELECGGVGCSIPMTKELDDALSGSLQYAEAAKKAESGLATALRQLADSESIRHAEKDILIAEVTAHGETKRKLAEATDFLMECGHPAQCLADGVCGWCETADLLKQREAELALEARRLDHILDAFDEDTEINGACALDCCDLDAMDADEVKEIRRAWRVSIDSAMQREVMPTDDQGPKNLASATSPAGPRVDPAGESYACNSITCHLAGMHTWTCKEMRKAWAVRGEEPNV